MPVAAGYYGVDLFFVISGYLITGILLRDRGHTFRESYRAFIGRRALRIFPAYYLLILVLFLIDFGPTREFFPWLATYTFNYPAAHVEAAGKENAIYYLWSLSVEEQFYLFWPPLVILLRDRKPLLFAVTLAVVAFGLAQISFGIVPQIAIYNFAGTLNRMGSLGLGALGAIWVSWRPLPARLFESLVIESLVVAGIFVVLLVSFRFRYPIMPLLSLFMVLKAANFSFRIRPLEWALTHRRIVWAGAISYGIYLYHVPINVLMTENVFDHFWLAIPFDSFGPLEKLRWHSWIVKLPLYSAMSIALAAASFRWFESPILRLKDRFFPYRSAPAS
jgi:peptidoglycan/LPS O-acetylase OafA/YrhL